MSLLMAQAGMMAGGTSGGGWTPADISTQLWVDASDSATVALASGAVSQWDDKSGNGHHAAQVTSGMMPALITGAVGGLDIIRFDGVDDQLNFTSMLAQASGQMVFLAGNTSSLDTRWRVFLERSPATVYTPAMYIGHDSGGYQPTVFWDSLPRAAWGSGVNRSAIIEWAVGHDGGTSTAETRVDGGTAVTTSFTGSGFSASWSAINGGGVQQSAIDVYEVVIVSNPTTDIRQKIEGYLAWKWGMVSNLPGGHPYKSAPP